MQDLKGQFSLGWVVPAAAPTTPSVPVFAAVQAPASAVAPVAAQNDENPPASPRSQGEAALDEAVVFYSQPLINSLKADLHKEMRLHDLARAAQGEIPDFKFEELSGVVHRLEELGIVEIVDVDSVTGNNLIRLLKSR